MAFTKLPSFLLPLLLIVLALSMPAGARRLLEITLPDIPKPQLPSIPDLIPELPMPELPHIPDIPKPELPEIPHLDIPELPDLPKIPTLPQDVATQSLKPSHSTSP
ncbi:unnamed protein product [Thlaspi arvense]|uniref:Uncharacterized protein n=1 Tax=Thlaspi arvense TaxID=13288 RepID=A0AAU9SGM5_THLAR|nr:unnamed protein product [Thlaspi arvense]